MKVALLLIACSIAAGLPPVRADYEVYKSGVGCKGANAGDCNENGFAGMTCYACDPFNRNHDLPTGGGIFKHHGCGDGYRNHYCANEPAYVPNAPSPPPTPPPTTKTKTTTTATETSLTTTSATTTTTTAATTTEWQAAADTCAWTCEEPGGCNGCPHHQGSGVPGCKDDEWSNCFRKGGEGDMEACEKDLERKKQEANCFTTTTVATSTPATTFTGMVTHVCAPIATLPSPLHHHPASSVKHSTTPFLFARRTINFIYLTYDLLQPPLFPPPPLSSLLLPLFPPLSFHVPPAPTHPSIPNTTFLLYRNAFFKKIQKP